MLTKTTNNKAMYVAIAALVAVAMFCICTADTSSADDETTGTFTYTDPVDGNVTITGFKPTVSNELVDIVIPSTIDGNNVTAIQAGAFSDVKVNSFAIDGTIAGYTVKSGALYSDNGTTLLAYPIWGTTEITFASGITKIADYACAETNTSFNMTTNHDKVEIPASVTEIGAYAFKNYPVNTIFVKGSEVTFADCAFAYTYGFLSGGTYVTAGHNTDIVFLGESPNYTNIAKGVSYYDNNKNNQDRDVYSYCDWTSSDFSDSIGTTVTPHKLPSAGDTFYPVGIKNGNSYTEVDGNLYTMLDDGTLSLVSVNGLSIVNANSVYYGLTYDVSKVDLSQTADDGFTIADSFSIGAKVTSIDFTYVLKMDRISSVSISDDNKNFKLLDSYNTYNKQKYHNYTILSKNSTVLYAFLTDINDTHSPTSYNVPSTVTQITANAFINASKLTTFNIGYQVTTVSQTAFGPLKFYEADGTTEISYNDVAGGHYTANDDGKLTLLLVYKDGSFTIPVQHYYKGTPTEITIPLEDTYDIAFISEPGRFTEKYTFTSSDESIVTVTNNRGTVTFTAGSTEGTATVTATYDYTAYGGDVYTTTVTINTVQSAKVGTEFSYQNQNYIVTAANVVNAYNPNGYTITKEVEYKDITYQVVGVTIDAHDVQPIAYTVESGHQYLSTDENGALYDADKTIIYSFPQKTTKMDAFVIPDTVKTIGTYAFYKCNIKAVTVPENVTTIEKYAFSFFGEQSTTIAADAIYIMNENASDGSDPAAFSNDSSGNYPRRTIYTFDEDLVVVAGIGSWVGKVVLPSKLGDTLTTHGMTMTCLGGRAMQVTAFTDDYTTYSLTTFKYICAEYYIQSVNVYEPVELKITSLVIGKDVSSISGLGGLTKLTSITVEEGNDTFAVTDGMLYGINGKHLVKVISTCTDLVIPDDITWICEGAVGTGAGLKSVSFPSSLVTISSGNFTGLTFKDAEGGNVIEATAANLAGKNFVASDNDSSVMIIDDHSVVITINYADNTLGTVGTETFRVHDGATYSTDGKTITFTYNGAVVKTFSANPVVEHCTCDFSSWSSTSGTISGDTSITANFTVDVEMIDFTVRSANMDYGLVNGKAYDTFSVPYGTTYSLSDNIMTFTYNGKDLAIAVATPADATKEYTYAVHAWSSTSGKVESSEDEIDVLFTRGAHMYNVTIKSSDSKIGLINTSASVTDSYAYGTEFTVNDSNIVFPLTQYTAKVNTAPEYHTYSMSGWDTVSGTVTGDLTITANFTDEVQMFTVTFVSNDETMATFQQETHEFAGGTTWSWEAGDDTIDFLYGNIITGIGYDTAVDKEPLRYHYTLAKVNGSDDIEGIVDGNLTITGTFEKRLTAYNVCVAAGSDAGNIDNVDDVQTTFYYGTVITINGNVISFACAEDGTKDVSYTANANTDTDSQIVNSFTSWSVASGATVTGDLKILALFETKFVPAPDADGKTVVTVKSNEVTVDNNALTTMKNAGGSFTAKFNDGAVTFNSAALSKVSSAGTLSIAKVTDESIIKKVNGATVYSVTFDDNRDFNGGSVNMRLFYALAVNEDAKDLAIGYINGDKVEKINATYDSETREIVFDVDHFSNFAIVHNDFFNDDNGGSNMTLIIAAVVVILAVAACAVFFMKKKGVF